MVDFIKSDKGKILYWIIGILSTIIFAIFLVPPLFEVVFNRIDPFILGMPFIVFMQLLLWIILGLLMIALYNVERIRRDL